MADRTDWQHQPQSQTSSVIDLDDMEVIDNDASDYESEFRDSRKSDGGRYSKNEDDNEDVRQRMGQHVTEIMWQAGKQQAKKAWNLYGNIDILRPYFDVQPYEVRNRLIESLIPRKASVQVQSIPRELYGPTMVIFTLIALLLFQMKSSGHQVQEGTLMGTSFLVCFSYWFGASSAIFLLSYLCNIQVTMIQVLSMLGYGLFGHCIVVFVSTVTHTSHSHILFYMLWALVGGLSTARMAFVILSRTSGHSQRIIVCSAIAILHLAFLLYLHFAYHQTVEEFSEVFDKEISRPVAEDVLHLKFVRDIGMEQHSIKHLNQSPKQYIKSAAIDKLDSGVQAPVLNIPQNVLNVLNTTVPAIQAAGKSLLKAAIASKTNNSVAM
ncbi:protein YIPF3 [Octopus bimaculoides]|uniref:Protein YIPF3 n=1 Tax=Octopus bimaculoides TaxID=37653 RepID=A0A0L8GH58_OCTBM|nr:protein YIPF3 [Octopus bimaculoides]